MLNISKVTLHNWKKAGKIPFYRINRRLYFRRSEIVGLLTPKNR
ncbi:MAG: helix-turn-helix domain-containing protein [Bacteroidales bacterium]|nr:helix-turn-helix domain-containing protein [Bacteroidales bacterium]MCF8405241.1 helix-turn-helix domain-containing protein [Bacteroidales bacterium]